MLKDLAEPYRIAFESSPTGMALISPDWHFVKANRAVCEMLGREEAELNARNTNDFVHPDDRGRALQELQRLLRGEVDEYTSEGRYVRPDGFVGWVTVHFGSLRDDAGNIKLILGMLEDITEQRRMREIHERLLGLVLVGKGLHALATTLGELTDSSVVLLDGYGQVLARTAAEMRVPSRAELAQVLEGATLSGLTVHPLHVGGEVAGYLVAEEPPEAGRLTAMAIEQAASSFALQLATTRNAEEVEHRLHGDLFDALLSDSPPDIDTLVRWGGRLGHDLSSFRALAVVRLAEPSATAGDPALIRLTRIAASVAQASAPGSIALPRADLILLALTADDADQRRIIAERLVERVAIVSGQSILVGLSRTVDDPRELTGAFRDARQAADAAGGVPRLGPVAAYEQLDLHHLVLGQRPAVEVERAARQSLQPLLDRSDDRMLTTLAVYFDSLCALETTAQRLGIHINTLRYRLGRIQELLQLDLQDARNRLSLQLALTALDLVPGEGRAGPLV